VNGTNKKSYNRYVEASSSDSDDELFQPRSLSIQFPQIMKAASIIASPAKFSPVKASPVKFSPVKASPVKFSPIKASPVRSPSPEQYSLSQGSPISPVMAHQARKYAGLGDSPTVLQRVIDQYSPFKVRSFENTYIQKRTSCENNKYDLSKLLIRKPSPFKLTLKETIHLESTDNNLVSQSSECPVPEKLNSIKYVAMFD
jgi:hypothetical protein